MSGFSHKLIVLVVLFLFLIGNPFKVRIEWEKEFHATKLIGQYIQGFEKQKQERIEWEKKNSRHKTNGIIYTSFWKT